MIKINKDFDDIPPSLLLDATHKKRGELIESKSYIQKSKYHKCYKDDDIQDQLASIYHNKCVYCEQKIEQFHVEHYRPKSIYYWLAYSWDNLMLVCPLCNQSKTDSFPLDGIAQEEPIIQYADTPDNRLLFHNLIDSLNQKECPVLVNPEKEEPSAYIQFSRDGIMTACDRRYTRTIEICKLNRSFLHTERRKILDGLADKIRAEISSTKDILKQQERVETCVRNYQSENKDLSTTFLGFRRYSYLHLLCDLIKEIIPRSVDKSES